MVFLPASLNWISLGCLLGGVGTLALLGYVWRHRGKPGANWFLVALGVQALWCFSYGSSLLVFRPGPRWLLETSTWIAISWLGFLFLAFALDYTGRRQRRTAGSFRTLLFVPALIAGLLLTNPFHHLVWSNFRLDPVFNAAAVSYTFEPLGYLTIGVSAVCVTLGTLLLFDTVLSYGPLYRREAAAVGLSTFLPGLATLVWLFGVGPVAHLNFAPLMMLPHLLLDGYAFVGSDMFETNPTTLRAAERSAIDELDTPIVILDTERRIVRLNPAARELFETSDPAALGAPIDRFLAADLDDDIETVRVGTPERDFAVSEAGLTDPGDTCVGHTLVLQDITDQKRREQRLDVFNRILRHNLRNEMTAIRGHAQLIEERADTDQIESGADVILDRSDALIDIGEKARVFEQAAQGGLTPTAIDLRKLLLDVAAAFEDRYPTSTVEVDIADGCRIRSDESLLRLAVENLVENGIEHAGNAEPHVTLTSPACIARDNADHPEAPRDETAVDTNVDTRDETSGPSEGESGEDDTVETSTVDLTQRPIIEVRDEGPGIDQSELAPLRAESENALQHGSSLGLWIIQWSVTTVGGRVAFESTEQGTVVSIFLSR
jgi:signal transduction histidine kinase